MEEYLQIRNRSNLILRNVSWHVPEQLNNSPIIGRRVSELIGCDNLLMLQAACDRHSSEIFVNKASLEDVNQDETDKVIAALYG